ncbi:MAG: hypothetical protein GX638_11300, partial [Crenarchaeota archaeon]|nr:hypothetical protein [Thermoproteota archaeon]
FSLKESKFDIAKVSVYWKKLIDNGVKIRLIIHHAGTNKETKSIFNIKDNLLKIRYTSAPPPASVALFDSKEALILMSTTEPEKSPVLLTDNKGLVAMAEEYFEQIWNRSTEISQENDY